METQNADVSFDLHKNVWFHSVLVVVAPGRPLASHQTVASFKAMRKLQ